MTTLRGLLLSGALIWAMAACGGAGSGGPGVTSAPSVAPAGATSTPVPTAAPTDDPYTYGY
jgi:hypothetical protein